MKKFNLQLFADMVQGKSIIYLFRILGEAASNAATVMAFTTENERSKSKDADVIATKDGAVRNPGAPEIEISTTAILKKDDDFVEKLEAAMDDDKKIEIWEVNLEAAGTAEGKYKATYYQGYLTEFTLTSSAEEHAEYECTFAIEGKGAKGEATVTKEQQALAAYVFTDTTAGTGA